MSEQFTPGPWEIEPGPKCRGSWIGRDGRWVALACGTDDGEAAANARLISAAPDLYAAGEELANAAADMHPSAPSSRSITRLHKAIEAWGVAAMKAEGRALNALSAKIEQEHAE